MKVKLQAKPYVIKLRCYWECLREKLGNLMGICWEHIGNKEKKSTPSPPQAQKGKKRVHQGCLVSHPIGCMIFSFQNCGSPLKRNKRNHKEQKSAPHPTLEIVKMYPKLIAKGVSQIDFGKAQSMGF
jgi:hypothetical protein